MRKIKKSDEAVLKEAIQEMQQVKLKHDALIKTLDDQIQALINEFNFVNGQAVEDMKNSYIESAQKLKKLSQAQLDNMEAYIGERSDKWYDADAGSDYQEWVSNWEDFIEDLDYAQYCELDPEVELKRLGEIKLPNLKV